MSNTKPLSPRDSLAAHRASSAKPLKIDEEITVVHLNGQERTVTFDQITGDKCDQITVRWGMAGIYSVDFTTGQLIGGKPKKKASVWRVHSRDLARIKATARWMREDRTRRMKADRLGSMNKR